MHNICVVNFHIFSTYILSNNPYDHYVRDMHCSYTDTEIYNSAITEYANDFINYILNRHIH